MASLRALRACTNRRFVKKQEGECSYKQEGECSAQGKHVTHVIKTIVYKKVKKSVAKKYALACTSTKYTPCFACKITGVNTST